MKKILIQLLLLSAALHAQVPIKGSTVDATQGYTINGAAPNNQPLCGNGTKAVFQASCGTASLPFYQTIQTNGSGLPQRNFLNFDSNFSVADSSPSTTVHLASTVSVNTSGNAATATNAVNAANATNATTAATATNANAVGGVALSGLCQTGGAGCPAASVGSRVCNANGCYIQYGDGTIEAWGITTSPPSSGSIASVIAVFPISFTTTSNLSITLTPVGNAAGDGNPHPVACQISSQSTSSLNAYISIPVQAGGSGYNNLLSSQYCAWHAIGS